MSKKTFWVATFVFLTHAAVVMAVELDDKVVAALREAARKAGARLIFVVDAPSSAVKEHAVVPVEQKTITPVEHKEDKAVEKSAHEHEAAPAHDLPAPVAPKAEAKHEDHTAAKNAEHPQRHPASSEDSCKLISSKSGDMFECKE